MHLLYESTWFFQIELTKLVVAKEDAGAQANGQQERSLRLQK